MAVLLGALAELRQVPWQEALGQSSGCWGLLSVVGESDLASDWPAVEVDVVPADLAAAADLLVAATAAAAAVLQVVFATVQAAAG